MGIFSKLFKSDGGGRIQPESLPVEGRAPEFSGITEWLNSPPRTMAELRGKVVLVDFWTYSCINCVRTLPHLKAWHENYKDKGLVIVGVHTPEFDFEKDPANVRSAIERFGIAYPVALDNDYSMWNAYKNRYWPAHYFVDANGNIRYHHFGEGGYDHSEAVIRALIDETGAFSGNTANDVDAKSAELDRIGTPETYLGFARVEYLGSPEAIRKDADQRYSGAKQPALNIFYLGGLWELRDEYAIPKGSDAKIVYRVKASKANLVMDGAPGARVKVLIDGHPPTQNERGADLDDDATVTVKEGRLYELIDRRGKYGEFLLELTFLDPGVKCYAFTFG